MKFLNPVRCKNCWISGSMKIILYPCSSEFRQTVLSGKPQILKQWKRVFKTYDKHTKEYWNASNRAPFAAIAAHRANSDQFKVTFFIMLLWNKYDGRCRWSSTTAWKATILANTIITQDPPVVKTIGSLCPSWTIQSKFSRNQLNKLRSLWTYSCLKTLIRCRHKEHIVWISKVQQQWP